MQGMLQSLLQQRGQQGNTRQQQELEGQRQRDQQLQLQRQEQARSAKEEQLIPKNELLPAQGDPRAVAPKGTPAGAGDNPTSNPENPSNTGTSSQTPGPAAEDTPTAEREDPRYGDLFPKLDLQP